MSELNTKGFTFTGEFLQTNVALVSSPIIQLGMTGATPYAQAHVFIQKVLPDGQPLFLVEG